MITTKEFAELTYDDQVEVLRRLWDTNELDDFYTLFNSIPITDRQRADMWIGIECTEEKSIDMYEKIKDMV